MILNAAGGLGTSTNYLTARHDQNAAGMKHQDSITPRACVANLSGAACLYLAWYATESTNLLKKPVHKRQQKLQTMPCVPALKVKEHEVPFRHDAQYIKVQRLC